MFKQRRSLMKSAAVGTALGLLPGVGVFGQAGYPSRPVRFVVPYPPGGGTDVIARIAQTRIAESLGQQVIIENRGGAGGSIGSDVVAKSAADGYTVLFTLSSHTINAAIYPKLPFNTERDFVAISQVASLPQILVAHPDYPVRNAQDVVKLARSKPGTVLYASVGNGTPGHLAGELMALTAGVQMTHVPYRGGGPQSLIYWPIRSACFGSRFLRRQLRSRAESYGRLQSLRSSGRRASQTSPPWRSRAFQALKWILGTPCLRPPKRQLQLSIVYIKPQCLPAPKPMFERNLCSRAQRPLAGRPLIWSGLSRQRL